MIGKIKGTGSYIPDRVITNDDLAKMVDTSDEWIQERTGIVTRHIMETDTVASMACKAAKKAVENARIEADQIDLIIVSTICSRQLLPCNACEVQKSLGAVHATCFDLNAACTGFVFAYNTAQAYIASGAFQTALIIGSEGMSDLVDWTDRGTCILFGDGAGAVLLTAEQGRQPFFVSSSEGEKGDALICQKTGFIQMDGQAVFKFAIKESALEIQKLLRKNKIKTEEIDYFILHQANRRIIESVSKRLGVNVDKFPMNLQECGNTSSASIPILLDQLNKEKKLKKGMKIVFAGFGAGLSLGASFAEW